MAEKTIYRELKKEGVTRRDFMKLCGMMVGAMGLTGLPALGAGDTASDLERTDQTIALVARALETKPRLPVIWMEFQDCAGCS